MRMSVAAWIMDRHSSHRALALNTVGQPTQKFWPKVLDVVGATFTVQENISKRNGYQCREV
jgi:hypothetical protein